MPATPGEDHSEDRQLALLVSGAIDYAIFMLDPQGNVLTWNRGAERMKGYTRDEIVGRHFSTLYTPEDVARDHPGHELRVALRDGRYEEEGWRVRKDGSRLWVTVVITPLFDETGRHVGFGKVSRDLTERRRAAEETQARNAELETANRELREYRRLVTSVRDYAIFMLDPNGYIVSWNAGAELLKGYTAPEIIGRHFSTFYTDPDRERDHPANELKIATREGRYEEEGWRVRKDGTTFWASVTITAVRDEDGNLTGFAKVTRDLTERRRAEEALREAVTELRAANEELERFATVAAHDMTDPLRTISGFAEILETTELAPETAAEYAGHIHASATRMASMLAGLLAYARAGKSGDPAEPISLADTFRQVVAELGAAISERGAQVTLDVPGDAQVMASVRDAGLVAQNLISNAIKFADAQRPIVAITAAREGDGWRVTVQDNGQGVSAADQAVIFRAFERGKATVQRAGYGLGLAIAERLVTHHAGRIGVESVPGDGSRFWFWLPAAPG